MFNYFLLSSLSYIIFHFIFIYIISLVKNTSFFLTYLHYTYHLVDNKYIQDRNIFILKGLILSIGKK